MIGFGSIKMLHGIRQTSEMMGDPWKDHRQTGGQLDVPKFNCGSLLGNHHYEMKLVQQQSDLVQVQQTNLQPDKTVKIDRYAAAQGERSIHRQSDKPLYGGGDLILVSTAYITLFQTSTDNTTKTVCICLSITQNNKTISVNVLIFYAPPQSMIKVQMNENNTLALQKVISKCIDNMKTTI